MYDMFLKYLEKEGGKGYTWKLRGDRPNEEEVCNIPGCALVDDMLLMSDDATEFEGMVKDFVEF